MYQRDERSRTQVEGSEGRTAGRGKWWRIKEGCLLKEGEGRRG